MQFNQDLYSTPGVSSQSSDGISSAQSSNGPALPLNAIQTSAPAPIIPSASLGQLQRLCSKGNEANRASADNDIEGKNIFLQF